MPLRSYSIYAAAIALASLAGCAADTSSSGNSVLSPAQDAHLAVIQVNVALATYARTFDVRMARLTDESNCKALLVIPLPSVVSDPDKPQKFQLQIVIDLRQIFWRSST